MIKLIWTFSSIALIFAIMIHNPKSQGMIGQNQVFNGTRSAEETLDKITWVLIGSFFTLTVYISTFSKFD